MASKLRAALGAEATNTISSDWLIDLRPCQHDNGYMDGRSQIKVHTDERTQVHSA